MIINSENAPSVALTAQYKRHNDPVVGLIPVFVSLTLILIIAAIVVGQRHDATLIVMLHTLILWCVVSVFIARGLHHHRFSVFGLANTVTALRAGVSCLLAGLIPISAELYLVSEDRWMWLATWLAAIALLMDGLDGYLARKSGLQSSFGARFDMETDALLALVIAVFLWQSQKLGIWVLSLGLMRYAFILASFKLVALKRKLYPSIRRKTVCVLQLSALCALLSPWVEEPGTLIIGGIALILLASSFLIDTIWLLKQP